MTPDRAPRTLQFGGLSTALLAQDRVALPILPNPPVDDAISEGLHAAITQGRLVAVTGPKGSGKSIALEGALQAFHAGEAQRTAASADYLERLVVTVGTVRTEEPTAILGLLYRATTGQELAMTGAKGRRHPYEYLRAVVVETLLQMQVAALVVDEAEVLADGALVVLRDVLTTVEREAPGRVVQAPDGATFTPSPIGVLLIGTEALTPRLMALPEWGERVLTCTAIPAPTWDLATAAYAGLLPALGQAIAANPEGWVALRQTCWSTPPSWRQVENHVRTYLRVMSYQHRDTLPGAMGFDEDVFRLAATTLARAA